MSIAVSTTDIESDVVRLCRDEVARARAESRRLECLVTAKIAADRAIAELRADPERRASLTDGEASRFICHKVRAAVREQNRAGAGAPEMIP